MQRTAIIKNGVVINIVDIDPQNLLETDALDADGNPVLDDDGNQLKNPPANHPPEGCSFEVSDTAQMGWLFNGTDFTDPNPPAPVATPAPAPTLSDLQAQLSAIAAQIAAMQNAT
jgi:hypothetical protein